jgi:hypothetical protein
MHLSSFARPALEGAKLTRLGWNGKGQFIQAQFPDQNSKMGPPYIFISTVDGKLVPWLASQTDLFAEDWKEVE